MFKKIVIDVSLDNWTMEQILSLKNSPILEVVDEIHLIHIYCRELCYHAAKVYDEEESNFDAIEKNVLKELNNIRITFNSNSKITKDIHLHCFFDRNIKIKAIDYIRKVNPDLVIAATRGEQFSPGLFSDSFSFFLVEYSPCDVFIIRPKLPMANTSVIKKTIEPEEIFQ